MFLKEMLHREIGIIGDNILQFLLKFLEFDRFQIGLFRYLLLINHDDYNYDFLFHAYLGQFVLLLLDILMHLVLEEKK